MALPLVPIVLISGIAGASGFITGSALTDKLGTALIVASIVVGLFLIFVLSRRFQIGVT